jgi:hypothetical protein
VKHFSFSEEFSKILPQMYIGLRVKYPLFLSGFLIKLIFSTIFERYSISNFMKIRPVGAELLHAGGQTAEHDEANSHFSQFCERD